MKSRVSHRPTTSRSSVNAGMEAHCSGRVAPGWVEGGYVGLVNRDDAKVDRVAPEPGTPGLPAVKGLVADS